MSSALTAYSAFINWLFSTGGIKVPTEFHERCSAISKLVDQDVSGIANTILGYGINAASEAKYKIECTDETLQKLLNIWLDKVNLEIPGIPTGLQELSKEYFKERWLGSSFCILRMKNWEKITAGQTSIYVPTTMWFVNGSSIHVKRPSGNNYKLGSDTFFLAEKEKNPIPAGKNEDIIVQKPYNRWHDQYSSPYLIRTGIYKNWLGMKTLQEKTDEIITKVLPYLFVIKENDKANEPITDPELQKIFERFKTQYKKYLNKKGELPTDVIPGTRDYSHLIPDLQNAVSEELFRQGTRTILAGLGFVDLLEISPSRQESRMNPKPFVAEVNAGVGGFRAILLDAVYKIIEKNKATHRKMFSENNKLEIINSPLKINIEQIMEMVRSGYDRGNISKRSFTESLGFDYDQQRLEREEEARNGDEDTMYPQVINNQEDKGKDTFVPSKPKNEKNEKQGKKPGTPESENYKNAELEEIAKCPKCGHEFAYLSVPEAGMGWVKCPKCEEAVTQENLIIAPFKNVEQLLKKYPYMKKYPKGALEVFIQVFNENVKKGDDYAFPVAYTAMKRWLKKHGYKKVGDKWVKSEEKTNE